MVKYTQEQIVLMHTDEAIAERLAASTRHSYVGDFILGAIDGLVTTFAIVASVAGAGLRSELALVLGVANLLADGFSMAAGNYLKAKADREAVEKMRKMEEVHIDLIPEGEKEEVRQIYINKGFKKGAVLEKIVRVITKDKKRWIDEMLIGEWGLQLEHPSPWRAGLVTMLAFSAIGAVPLVPFVFFIGGSLPADVFMYSATITLITFFIVGYCKGVVLEQPCIKSGLETFIVGAIASAMAFIVGYGASIIFQF